MPSISILHKNECCGCRCCEQICPVRCISMQDDSEGFIYPHVDENKCIDCGLCLKTCSFQKQSLKTPFRIYGAKSCNTELKKDSASGGIFASIAKLCLDTGYHIFGCSYCDNFKGASHIEINQLSDLRLLQGSKYVQSDTNETFSIVKSLLDKGEKVIYSGTGCQIQGLKNFLRKDYPNLLLIDILCFGVPSPMIFRDYVGCMEKKFGKISHFLMRDKSEGWGQGKMPKLLFGGRDINIPISYRKAWFDIYFSKYVNRPSCYNCKFTRLERCGDVTLGDYWGIEKYHPEFIDSFGVSLVLVNTTKGLDLIHNITPFIDLIQLSKDECLQPVLCSPQTAPPNRDAFWQRYHKHGFKDVMHSYFGIRFKSPLLLKINRKLGRNIF